MIIHDRKIKQKVDVSEKECPNRKCYWARPDPGVFTQGQGYRSRTVPLKYWICGTREIHGCPREFCK